jgi:hypothetical protein
MSKAQLINEEHKARRETWQFLSPGASDKIRTLFLRYLSRGFYLCATDTPPRKIKIKLFFNISLKFDKKVTIGILVIVKLFFSTQGLSLFSRAMYYKNFHE